jgi:hypothetical protein
MLLDAEVRILPPQPAPFISGMGCAVRGYIAESGTSSDYAVSEFLRAVGALAGRD